jgi:hypothetical protein
MEIGEDENSRGYSEEESQGEGKAKRIGDGWEEA